MCILWYTKACVQVHTHRTDGNREWMATLFPPTQLSRTYPDVQLQKHLKNPLAPDVAVLEMEEMVNQDLQVS